MAGRDENTVPAGVTRASAANEAEPNTEISAAEVPTDAFTELIRSANDGERLQIKRTGPSNLPKSMRGFLETLEVSAAADVADLLQLVRARWGGGTYTVQRVSRPNEPSTFRRGAAVLDIAGPPLWEGRPVNLRTGEVVEETAMVPRTTNPTPVHVVAPSAPPPSPDAGVVSALTNALVAAKQDGRELGLPDLVALARELQPAQPQARTPLADLRQHVAFLGELRDVLDGAGGSSGGGQTPSSDIGVPKSLEEAFMQFFKGGAMQGMFGGGGGGMQPAPAPNLPAQGPPGALWDPARGGWVWPAGPARHPQPAPATPAPGVPPSPPSPAPAAQPAPQPEPEEEWEDEPLTPDEVVEALQEMNPEQRRNFVDKIQSGLGPSIVETFTKSMDGES